MGRGALRPAGRAIVARGLGTPSSPWIARPVSRRPEGGRMSRAARHLRPPCRAGCNEGRPIQGVNSLATVARPPGATQFRMDRCGARRCRAPCRMLARHAANTRPPPIASPGPSCGGIARVRGYARPAVRGRSGGTCSHPEMPGRRDRTPGSRPGSAGSVRPRATATDLRTGGGGLAGNTRVGRHQPRIRPGASRVPVAARSRWRRSLDAAIARREPNPIAA